MCGCKTLSKTRRTTRLYAPTATVFLFNSIIKFTVPRTPSFSIRLLEKGSEGSACGISFKEKLLGRPSQSNGSNRCQETEKKNCNALTGYAVPIANVGPKPRMDMSGENFSSPTLAFILIKSYINPIIQTLHMQSLHLNVLCRVTKR